MVAVDGLSVRAISAGALTVTLAEALMDPELAWMAVFPKETPATRPELLTVAAEDEELHVAVEVRSCTEPSE
jgi:hypothetical protein